MVSTRILTKGGVEFAERIIKEMNPTFVLSYPGHYITALYHTQFLTSFASDLKECEEKYGVPPN